VHRSARFHRGLLLLPLTLIAACGGSEASDKATTQPADRTSGTPDQILAAAAADIAKVRSYHVEGTETDKDGVSRLSGDVSSEGRLRFSLKTGKRALGIIVVGPTTYLRANEAFWDEEGGASEALAATLADRWVKAPAGADDTLKGLLPKDLSYCLRRDNGSLSKVGSRSLEGRKVVVIADRGDKPGTAPGELSVSTSGRVLPVRVTQTGKERPGGRRDPRCDSNANDDEDDTTTSSDIRLSDYDKPVRITAPADSLDLDRLQRDNNSTPA